MSNYWFRICFERECEDEREVEEVLDMITDEFWESDKMHSLSTTFEKRKVFVKSSKGEGK